MFTWWWINVFSLGKKVEGNRNSGTSNVQGGNENKKTKIGAGNLHKMLKALETRSSSDTLTCSWHHLHSSFLVLASSDDFIEAKLGEWENVPRCRLAQMLMNGGIAFSEGFFSSVRNFPSLWKPHNYIQTCSRALVLCNKCENRATDNPHNWICMHSQRLKVNHNFPLPDELLYMMWKYFSIYQFSPSSRKKEHEQRQQAASEQPQNYVQKLHKFAFQRMFAVLMEFLNWIDGFCCKTIQFCLFIEWIQHAFFMNIFVNIMEAHKVRRKLVGSSLISWHDKQNVSLIVFILKHLM